MKKKKYSKNRLQQEASVNKVKSKNKYAIAFAAIVLFVMVFSILAIKLGNTNEEIETLEYNGFKFSINGNIWVSKINGIDYNFEYNPKDLEGINSIELKDYGFNTKIYLLYDPIENNHNDYEIQRLRQFLASKGTVNLACIKEEGCGDLPIIDCRNTNKAVYLKVSDKNEIYNEENCTVLSAVKEEELKVINRFIYGVLGVINNG